MKINTEICPVCGTCNKDLNLDETNGFYECEKCKSVVSCKTSNLKFVNVPLFDLRKPEDMQRLLSFVNGK